MDAKAIQHALFGRFGQAAHLLIPNYTPNRWFECDLFRVTKAGRSDEFEIKLSVSDFKADAKKGPDERQKQVGPIYQGASFDPRTKHERLAAGDPNGPSRFWFAMPEDIAAKVEIPPWAGLITFRLWRGNVMANRISGTATEDFKPAPLLHRSPCPPKVLDHAQRVFYWRYWNLRRGQKEEAGIISE